MSAPVLEINNIHKRFDDLEVLKGISLTAHAGDVISLVGSSGSGKSTLLRCINLLEMPDEGDITVSGQVIELKHSKGQRVASNPRQVQQLRSRIAMVFQQFNLWAHMTILQNVMEAPMQVQKIAKAEARDSAMAYLEKVGIADKAASYPVALSGGQQQRVAIARALAMHPEAILFDEPTSALDPELVGEVLGVMRNLAEEGTTMIVVTHEMAFARDVSSHAVYLYQGRVEEQGEPREMFGSPKTERFQQFLSSTLN